jgi:glycosyltransferase involved in cell wall biosynthesis
LKIGIGALLLSSKPGSGNAGISRYCRQIISGLISLETDHEWHLFVSSEFEVPSEWKENPKVFIHPIKFQTRRKRIFWENFQANRDIKKNGLDAFFSLADTAPLFRSVPVMVMVHDLFVLCHPEMFDKSRVIYRKLVTRRWTVVAKRIVVASEATKRALMEVLQVDPSKITVVPVGLGNQIESRLTRPTKSDLEDVGIKHDRYFFTLSTLEPRKNLPRLLQAHTALIAKPEFSDVVLVIGGAKGWKDSELNSILEPMIAEGSVQLLGYVPDDHLATIFRGSIASVSASMNEGFGVPVLEALRARTPVLCSDRGAMSEITLEFATYFDPYSVDSILSALVKAIQEPKDDAYIERAFERSNDFNWLDTSKKTLSALESLFKP